MRAFVRQNDHRSLALKAAGVEIVVGDLFDYRDVRTAMVDVQRAYHCPPFALNLLRGATVKYQDASIKLFSKAALAQGFPLFDIAHMRHHSVALQSGVFATGAPTDHVEQITGKPAEPFIKTARRYLKSPELIHPMLEVGSKIGAFGFLAKMLLTRAPDLDKYEQSLGYPVLKNPVMAAVNPEWRKDAERGQLHLLGSHAAP